MRGWHLAKSTPNARIAFGRDDMFIVKRYYSLDSFQIVLCCYDSLEYVAYIVNEIHLSPRWGLG